MIKLKGLGVSPGIAAGYATIYKPTPISYVKECKASPDNEIQQLRKAIEISTEELKNLYLKTKSKLGPKEASLFEAQMMMVQDEEFIAKIENEIITNRINGEWAVANVRDYYISVFESMDNEYLKERALDIRDIASRLIRHMQNSEERKTFDSPKKSIVVARELMPSDTPYLNSEGVLGLLTETGESESHCAVLARTLGIPTVVAIPRLMESIHWNDFIAFDADSGEVYISPTEDVLKQLLLRRKKHVVQGGIGQVPKEKARTTKDGHPLAIEANVASLSDIKAALDNEAEGIGLFRSECLFLGRYECPSEQEQFEIYQAAALKMGNRPLTIRTLDINVDKQTVRLCLDRQELFKTQLRAILKASAFGNVQVLFPMICTLQELRTAKNILEESKSDLEREGYAYNKNITVGMMIETPAAALMSDVFAREADFFVIGANDLLQYTLALNRQNATVQHLNSLLQPSFLRLIQKVVDHAHQNNIKVGISGEAVHDKRLLPVWLSLGIDEMIVKPSNIAPTREELGEIDLEDVQKWVSELLSLPTDIDVERFLAINSNKLHAPAS